MSSLKEQGTHGDEVKYIQSLEDDSINGSVIGKTKSDVSNEDLEEQNKPKLPLQERLIEYAVTHDKPTKGELFIHVSSSGTAGAIISALVSGGIFIEKQLDCGSCVYFEVDQTKVNIV